MFFAGLCKKLGNDSRLAIFSSIILIDRRSRPASLRLRLGCQCVYQDALPPSCTLPHFSLVFSLYIMYNPIMPPLNALLGAKAELEGLLQQRRSIDDRIKALQQAIQILEPIYEKEEPNVFDALDILAGVNGGLTERNSGIAAARRS